MTGGRGRWAQPVAKILRANGISVSIFSRKSGPNKAPLSSLQGSILAGFDAVLDMAWTNVPASAQKKDGRCLSWVETLLRRISKIRKNPPLYIFTSTCAVYGETSRSLPASEKTRCRPQGDYAKQKMLAEKIIQKYAAKHRIPWVILRISNLYGILHPTQTPQGIIPKLIQSGTALRPIFLWGQGGQAKDFLHVKDFCQALRLVVRCRVQGTYNVCFGKPTQIRKVVKTVEKAISRPLQIEFVPAKSWDVRKSFFTNQKLKKTIPWRPTIRLEQGIQQMVHPIQQRHAMQFMEPRPLSTNAGCCPNFEP